MLQHRALATLTGLPIIAAERCAMGFENQTMRATLADGQVVIVQQLANRGMAAHKIRLAQQLPARLAEAGIRAPTVLTANAQATPPFVVREFIPGEIGASWLAEETSAQHLALAMGRLLQHIAQLPTDGLGLHSGWANPARLAAQAQAQLRRNQDQIAPPHREVLAHSIGQIEAVLATSEGVFAHGDYCPVNVIVIEDERRTTNDERRTTTLNTQYPNLALIDLEFARVAHPLLDVAWWNWIVRYHHPVRWQQIHPYFLEGAGIVNTAELGQRITIIQHLRLLEALDYNAAMGPERGAHWAGRLAETIKWPTGIAQT